MKNGKTPLPLLLILGPALLAGCVGLKTSTSPSEAGGTSYTVSTFAGETGVRGAANGAGVTATFNYPFGVAVDASGNVYAGDLGNQLIRKITPGGVVSTLAGIAGVGGATNGAGATATFNHPQGLAVDGFGNVYVADTVNNRIRLITPTGMVSTFAGSGASGAQNGLSGSASFKYPYGVALDGLGNLYVADFNNHLIRKVSGGMVSTLAGQAGIAGVANGPASTALFDHPQGVAVDSSGNVYVADTGNSLIRKITPAGMVSTLAGEPRTGGNTNGPGGTALFNSPDGVVVDASGNLYVADSFNNQIRKIIPDGTVIPLAGIISRGAVNGPASLASFNNPYSVAVDSFGNLYVGDTNNHLIRKIIP